MTNSFERSAFAEAKRMAFNMAAQIWQAPFNGLLIAGAHYNSRLMTDFAFACGADVHASQDMALCEAVFMGHRDMVKHLVEERYADILAQDYPLAPPGNRGQIVAGIAAWRDIKTLEYFLDHLAEGGMDIKPFATQALRVVNGAENMKKIMEKYGVRPEEESIFDIAEGSAYVGDLTKLKLIMEDHRFSGEELADMLNFASIDGHWETVEYLAQQQPDFGKVRFHIAVTRTMGLENSVMDEEMLRKLESIVDRYQPKTEESPGLNL